MKTLPILLIILTVSSCLPSAYRTNTIRTYFDEFKNTRMYSLEHKYSAVDSRGHTLSVSHVYQNEVFSYDSARWLVFAEITAFNNFYALADKLYMSANEKRFQLEVMNSSFSGISTTENNTETVFLADSSSREVVTSVDSRNGRKTTFQFILNQEHIDALKSSNFITFRYYLGPRYYSATVGIEQKDSLHVLLNQF